MQPVVLPILDANMTHGVVRAWLKREGDTVEVGEPLFEVETDKVNAVVDAEVAGVLRQIVAPVGTRLAVLSIVAFIGAADEAIPPREHWDALMPVETLVAAEAGTGERGAKSGPAAEAAAVGTRVAASPAARRLARERGLSLDRIRPTGARSEITRADVERVAAEQSEVGIEGQVDSAFLDLLRRDPCAFGALSSEMKVQLYREHGAQIGERVRIEAGAVIIANEITVGDASTIGAGSTLECERVRLGRLVSFGRRTRVHCRSIEIGDALWSKDDVLIGGGGSDEAGARLRAGDACFVGEGAYLNTCRPLTLGDEVCIGSRAMLFTHSHWQSVLRGYSSQFGPIQIGDHVFIGNSAFVFPGVTIGAGATVMVNSFVAVNVAPQTLVGGVPAQVVRHVAMPSRSQQVAIMREQMAELATALGEHGFSVRRQEHGDEVTLAVGDGTAVHFRPSWGATNSLSEWRRVVVLAFCEGAVPTVAPGMTLFDLQACGVHGNQDDLSDEVREFCRRRGMRFRPFAWRYRVGHCEGDRFYPR